MKIFQNLIHDLFRFNFKYHKTFCDTMIWKLWLLLDSSALLKVLFLRLFSYFDYYKEILFHSNHSLKKDVLHFRQTRACTQKASFPLKTNFVNQLRDTFSHTLGRWLPQNELKLVLLSGLILGAWYGNMLKINRTSHLSVTFLIISIAFFK